MYRTILILNDSWDNILLKKNTFSVKQADKNGVNAHGVDQSAFRANHKTTEADITMTVLLDGASAMISFVIGGFVHHVIFEP